MILKSDHSRLVKTFYVSMLRICLTAQGAVCGMWTESVRPGITSLGSESQTSYLLTRLSVEVSWGQGGDDFSEGEAMGSWGVGGTVSGRKEPSCRPGSRKRQYLA